MRGISRGGAEGQRDRGTEVVEQTKIRTFRDLIVWQKAMTLVSDIYEMSKQFPKDEQYGLSMQMRRSAVSVPSNIAEGYGRYSKNEYVRFCEIALGSLFELQTQIEIAMNLKYIEKDKFDNLYETGREVERLLTGLIKSVKVHRDIGT